MARTIADVLAETRGLSPDAVRERVQAHYIALLKAQPRDSFSIEMDIPFGPHERQRLDIHIPKETSATPRPIVMFVFGGGFVHGHKNLHGEWIYGNVPDFFARNGMIGINVNYRLAPEYEWPAGAQDVAAAVAWVRKNIAKYGGDPDQLFIAGHSSGATHVATYALRPELHPEGGPGIAGVMILSGGFYMTPETPEPNHLAYYGADITKWAHRNLIANAKWGDFDIFLSTAELEPYSFNRSFTSMLDALTQRSGRMPRVANFLTHNHYSEQMAIGTGDEQIESALLGFVRDTIAKRKAKQLQTIGT